MPGFASTVHSNRQINPHPKTMLAPLLLVLITGACCWGTYFIRSAGRSSSTPHSAHTSVVSVSGEIPRVYRFAQLPQEEDELLKADDTKECMNLAGLDHETTDLTVQGILLSPNSRIAMICDHVVSEGQTVTLRGRSFEVTAVSESGVDLAFAETTFHLPFAVGTEPELELPQD